MATPDELRRHLALQDALLAKQAETSLRSFVAQAWPLLEPAQPYLHNWHIDLLIEHLEAVTAGQITRLLINIPPRYMKSLLVSVLWPTWEWLQRPEGRWIFVSHTESLSIKHSTDRRTVLQSDWFQDRWGRRVQLAADQNLKGAFQNTKRGVMHSTSIGGSITGLGGNRIVVDDPHNPLQVESDTQRETVLNYFDRTLSTRLDDKKNDAIVVVMQRLHEMDVSARCLDLGFTHVCLPATAEGPGDVVFPTTGRIVHRETGDLLWPEREGLQELDALKRQLGSDAFAGQYQQRPVPAGGSVLKRDWFKFYDELPSLSDFAQSWDMAFKDTPESDFVVGLVAGRKDANVYLIDRVKGQWDFSRTCREVQALSAKYPKARMKLVEEAANGVAIVNGLKNLVPGLIAVRPEGGKVARAQAIQPLVEAGNVYLPNPRPHGKLDPQRAWVDDFLHQCSVFPHGVHDDDVDAFTQLMVKWHEPRAIVRIRRLGDDRGPIGPGAKPWNPYDPR